MIRILVIELASIHALPSHPLFDDDGVWIDELGLLRTQFHCLVHKVFH